MSLSQIAISICGSPTLKLNETAALLKDKMLPSRLQVLPAASSGLPALGLPRFEYQQILALLDLVCLGGRGKPGDSSRLLFYAGLLRRRTEAFCEKAKSG